MIWGDSTLINFLVMGDLFCSVQSITLAIPLREIEWDGGRKQTKYLDTNMDIITFHCIFLRWTYLLGRIGHLIIVCTVK